MGKCFLMKSGPAGAAEATGGGELNFTVVGGTSQPENPTENTLWIDTDAEITSWVISMTQPIDPIDGMVWISTSTSSSAEFNALKENELQVLPLLAKQYISGVWTEKNAKTYQEGEWVDWIIALYDNGNECTELTGGWKKSIGTGGSVTFGTDKITMSYSGSTSRFSSIYTTNKVKVSGSSKLYCEVDILANGTFFDFGLANGLFANIYDFDFVCRTSVADNKTGKMILSVDLSGVVDSECYAVARTSGVTTVNVYKMWLA